MLFYGDYERYWNKFLCGDFPGREQIPLRFGS
jgi:hypothetical protein